VKVIIKSVEGHEGTIEHNGMLYELDKEIHCTNAVYNELYAVTIVVEGLNKRCYDIEVLDMTDEPVEQVQEFKTEHMLPLDKDVEEQNFADKIVGELEAYNLILDQVLIKAESLNDGDKVDVENLVEAATAIYKVASRQ